MSYYHKCPYCQCNLDPGETCDCQNRQKEKDRPHTNETGPQKTAVVTPLFNSVAQKREKVNTGDSKNFAKKSILLQRKGLIDERLL